MRSLNHNQRNLKAKNLAQFERTTKNVQLGFLPSSLSKETSALATLERCNVIVRPSKWCLLYLSISPRATLAAGTRTEVHYDHYAHWRFPKMMGTHGVPPVLIHVQFGSSLKLNHPGQPLNCPVPPEIPPSCTPMSVLRLWLVKPDIFMGNIQKSCGRPMPMEEPPRKMWWVTPPHLRSFGG